jgi:hypothetical protein
MDVDVSHAVWSWLIASLTMNIFQTITPFYELLAPLEILQRTLRNHVILTEFWELRIFSLSLSAKAILSVLSCLSEL